MSAIHETIEAGSAAAPVTIKVWDRFVRLSHWSLAALFITAYATGDEIERVHIAAGYAIAGLLALRIVWGFIGPRHARFSNIVRSPSETLAYLRAVALLRAPRYLGHNPAGGLMIVVLIVMLGATCVTGYMMTTDMFWGAKWTEDVHEALANTTLALVIFHVLGVLVASFQHSENLVAAMIIGRKRAS